MNTYTPPAYKMPELTDFLESLPEGVVICQPLRTAQGLVTELVPVCANRNALRWLALRPEDGGPRLLFPAGFRPDLAKATTALSLNRPTTDLLFNEPVQCWMQVTYSALGDALLLRMEHVMTSEVPPQRPWSAPAEPRQPSPDRVTASWPCLHHWPDQPEGWWSE